MGVALLGVESRRPLFAIDCSSSSVALEGARSDELVDMSLDGVV